MSKICPINNSIVLYLDCLECDDKICKKQHKVPRMSNNESTKVSKTKIYPGDKLFFMSRFNHRAKFMYIGRTYNKYGYPDKRLLYRYSNHGNIPGFVEVDSNFLVKERVKLLYNDKEELKRLKKLFEKEGKTKCK